MPSPGLSRAARRAAAAAFAVLLAVVTAGLPAAAARPAEMTPGPAEVTGRGATAVAGHPAGEVDPLIGSAGGGNTFPGAVVPFGMVQWSPETTRGDATRAAAPGGYAYEARRVRGFSLTHLSGTGCRGASGDVPFMPHSGEVGSSLEPAVAADIAQSLLNQATQNGGAWDRWTHQSGATHVMAGDPSAPAVAGIVAFGGTGFDVAGAFASLARAATVPTAEDLGGAGCPVECAGQRPALDRWLALHYVPAGAPAWGGAGETLEDATADFSLAQLAGRLGDRPAYERFLARAGYWRNLWNPAATAAGGYLQERNADGSWPAFDPASDQGFAEGSSAQYSWMVPFDARGLIELMGGDERASRRAGASTASSATVTAAGR